MKYIYYIIKMIAKTALITLLVCLLTVTFNSQTNYQST